jgi:hypothetical protein|tara:strand:- start:654 stop:812 length:159 start_codon:yes stop_codon:yes gene_type:complete
MSGDVGLENEPIIFYSKEMTKSKLVVLKHKGVKFNLYNEAMKTMKETHERRN